MTRCNICNEDTSFTCICGYCLDCINKYGHDKCFDMLKELEKEK